MLTEAQIRAGYTLVFGTKVVPTTTNIMFWQGLSSDGSITVANFPAKLSTLTLLAQQSEDIYQDARNYLWYEPLAEVIRPMANWSDGISERISFNTDVMISRSGLEQRQRLIRKPKISVEYAILLYKKNLQHFFNQVNAVQGQLVQIPMWQGLRTVEGNLLELPQLTPGKYLLYFGYNKFEKVTLVKVGNELMFEHQPETNWLAAPWIIPLQTGSLRERVSFSAISSQAASGRVLAHLEPHITPKNPRLLERIGQAAVFPFEQNWVTATNFDLTRPNVLIDYGTGMTKFYDLHGYSDTLRTVEFFGYRDKYGIRDFFLDCAGRFAEFYVPTFMDDITLVGNFVYSQAQSELWVQDVGFADYYARNGKLSQFLWVEFTNRPAIICQIGLPTSVNGIERIPVKSKVGEPDPFGFSFNASEVKRISYLPKCRFESDSLEVSWITPNVYKVSTSFRTVQ